MLDEIGFIITNEVCRDHDGFDVSRARSACERAARAASCSRKSIRCRWHWTMISSFEKPNFTYWPIRPSTRSSDKANKLPALATRLPQRRGHHAGRLHYFRTAVPSLWRRDLAGSTPALRQLFHLFWRAKRDANITMRLEYRQEKLHAHVQAQEISFPNARGNHKTDFKVIGDDYFEDGRVIAWRCLLIENGRIVAENRSFIWDESTARLTPPLRLPDAACRAPIPKHFLRFS